MIYKGRITELRAVINVIGSCPSIKNQFRGSLNWLVFTAPLDIAPPSFVSVASSYQERLELIVYQAQGSRTSTGLIEGRRLNYISFAKLIPLIPKFPIN